MFVLTTTDFVGHIFHWSRGATSTKLVSRKSSFVVTTVYDASWRVPLVSQLQIPPHGIFDDTRVGHMYLKTLDFMPLLS
jgi:hypothetical protein